MQFDLFDKKIKEAAENHHPAYDEKAWEKMEKMLDKHLPEKKDRRRFIFFLLFFLLLGGGATYLLIDKPWKTNNTIANTEKTKDQKISNPVIENKPQQNQSQSNIVATDKNQEQVSNNQVSNKNDESNLTQNNTSQPKIAATTEKRIDLRVKKPQVERSIVKNNDQSKQIESSNKITVSPNNKNNSNVDITPSNKDQQSSVINNNNNVVTKNNNTSSNPVIDNSSNKNEEKNVTPDKNVTANNTADVSKKEEVVKNEQQQKKNTGKNKQKGNFAFSASFGPDLSKAGSSSDLSKVNWSYGAGVSYTLKKFTLRSGFYVAKKVYNADAKDYKLEYTLPPNIKFINVNADCKVYEIPLNVAYNFASNKNSSWFASLGLSSYLMKSEKYQNWYKNTSTNTTYPRSFQYSSKNNHYFSVLDLSAGYSYRINNTFSLSAEPYLKLPLSGIGEGKVHLNSAGILFSVGIKPFKAKSK